MQTVGDDDRFYMNTYDDEITEKDSGWEFLRMYGKDDNDESDSDGDDSAFSEGKNAEASSVRYILFSPIFLISLMQMKMFLIFVIIYDSVYF